MGLEVDDEEGGYTMEAILRARGYSEEMIEQILARKKAQLVLLEED